MFIFNLILIVFLVVITFLIIALIIVRQIMWRINKGLSNVFSSHKKHSNENNKTTINDIYTKKNSVKPNQGEYIDFEEIKE